MCLLLLNTTQGAIWPSEGSVVLKAGEKKVIHGIACIYSENPVPATYTIAFSGEVSKFVDFVEPQGFTVNRVPCGGGDEGRKCVTRFCNNPNSTYTRMISAYFSGPREFAFDFPITFGLHTKKMHDYQGGMRATGKVGSATTNEVVGFWIHFYPYNGWLIVFVIIGVGIVSVVLVMFYKKQQKQKKKIILYCPNCRLEYSRGTKFCSTCGQPLVEGKKG